MVLVLPMQGDQVATQLAELSRMRVAAVDARRAALTKLSLQCKRRTAGFENALHSRPLRAVPNLVDTAPRAEGQAERVDDERLAAAGLAGQEVEAGTKAHPGLRDQSQVANVEFLEHYLFGTRGRPQPSLFPSRR